MSRQENAPVRRGFLSAVDRQRLLRSPLTVDLVLPVVEKLATMARTTSVSRGNFLFFPGKRASTFYLVMEGRVKVFQPDQEGRECIVRVAGSNDILCLAAVFGGQTYQAVGEAVTACRVLAFPGDSFMNLMLQEATLISNVLRFLSLRIENVCRKQCLTRNLPAVAQVAHYLMERSTGCDKCRCCPLDLRPLQITAQEIGIARETLSRIIGQMRREGIIDCCRGCVTIRNPALVEHVACCLPGRNTKDATDGKIK